MNRKVAESAEKKGEEMAGRINRMRGRRLKAKGEDKGKELAPELPEKTKYQSNQRNQVLFIHYS